MSKDEERFEEWFGRCQTLSYDDETAAKVGYLAALASERERVAKYSGLDFREGHIRDNADPDQLREMLWAAGNQIAELKDERERVKGKVEELANKLSGVRVALVYPPMLEDANVLLSELQDILTSIERGE